LVELTGRNNEAREDEELLPISKERSLGKENILKEKIKALETAKALKIVGADTNKLEALIEKLEKAVIALQIKKEALDNEYGRYSWWMSKGLGASGIKAYVFSAMLAQINQQTEKYSERLGMRIRFSVDLSKVSKPFTTTCFKGEHEIMYEELSGGQKQRIDIVMALALHDVISVGCNVNIIVFDEAFEGLDEEGRSAIMELIRSKAEKKTAFLISHADILDSLGAKTITVAQDAVENTIIS